MYGTVLVVDEAVGVVGVSFRNETRGRIQILIAPGAKVEFGGKVNAWPCSIGPRVAAP